MTDRTAQAPASSRDVLDFWFGRVGEPAHGTARPEWFRKDDAFDRAIAGRFGATIEQALRGELEAWAGAPETALAQVLLLDQFTRNAFRGTPRAFAGDPRALAIATTMVGARHDEALPPLMRSFVYMPFEHAESMGAQDEAVRLFARLAAAHPGDDADRMLDYAERHRAIVARFGRFPHRNAVLGRRSTAEEEAFLEEPGSGF